MGYGAGPVLHDQMWEAKIDTLAELTGKSVESVKAVSEIYMPIAGEILEINETLNDNPALVNESPYADGWMIKIKPSDSTELTALMDRAAYLANIQGK